MVLTLMENSSTTTNANGSGWVRYGGNACQKCKKKHKGCMYNIDGKAFICTQEPSDIIVNKGLGGWLHTDVTAHSPTFNTEVYRSSKVDFREQVKYASVDRINAAYEWLLSEFPLSEKDEAYLKSCGLKDLSDYGTLPTQFNHKYKCDISLNYGGIAGFYTENNQTYLNCWSTGIIIAVRSHEGKIVSIEIRLDDESKKRSKDDDLKYKPLTSAHKNNGIKADVKQYGVIKPKEKKKKWLYITEGRKKGQVLSEKKGVTVLYVRGVANWHKIPQDLVEYFTEFDKVIIAYDMDNTTNKLVEQQLFRLSDSIVVKGEFIVEHCYWDDEYKGVDDALLNNAVLKYRIICAKPTFYNLNKANQLIREEANILLSNLNGKFNVFEATTGAGKSRAWIDILNERHVNNDWPKVGEEQRDARILWLCDNNYKLLEETHKEFKFPVAIIEGRSEKELSPFYCAKKEDCDTAGSAGHNIIQSVCLECPLLQHCAYLKSTASILERERFVIGVKASFLNDSPRLEKFDIVIMDESIHNNLFKIMSINKSDISLVRKMINFFKGVRKEYNDFLPQLDFLEQVIDMNVDSGNNELTSVEYDWVENENFEKDNIAFKDTKGEDVFVKKFLSILPKSVVYVIGDRVIIAQPRYELIERMKSRTIINLDATPIHCLLSVLDPVYHKFNIKQNIEIHKLMGLKGSKNQMSQDLYIEQYTQAIRAIRGNSEGQMTVLSSKAFIDYMERNCSDLDLLLGWYGNHTKGFNKFEDSHTLVIAGDYCRNINSLKILAGVAELMGLSVDLETLVNEDSSAEINQAIGRIRGVRHAGKPKKVYLLTNRNVMGLQSFIPINRLGDIYGQEDNQQKLNVVRHDVAESKVIACLEKMKAAGFDLSTIPANIISMESGVSISVVKTIASKYIQQQLSNAGVDHSTAAVLVSVCSPMAKIGSAKVINKKSALEIASILNNINSDDILIAQFKSTLAKLVDRLVYMEFSMNTPPVGVNPTKWRSFVAALSNLIISDVDLSRTDINGIAKASGVSRNIVAKYLTIMELKWSEATIDEVKLLAKNTTEWTSKTHSDFLCDWLFQMYNKSVLKQQVFDLEISMRTESNIESYFKESLDLYTKWLHSDGMYCVGASLFDSMEIE